MAAVLCALCGIGADFQAELSAEIRCPGPQQAYPPALPNANEKAPGKPHWLTEGCCPFPVPWRCSSGRLVEPGQIGRDFRGRDRQGVEANDAARGKYHGDYEPTVPHYGIFGHGRVDAVEDEGQHGVEGVGRVNEVITVQSGEPSGLLSAGVSVFAGQVFGDGDGDVQGDSDDGGCHVLGSSEQR